MGREAKTNLTICNLPPYFRKSAIQPSLVCTLCTIGRKYSSDGFVMARGRPKYVKGRVPTLQLSAAAKCANLSGDILIGIMLDLC
jgi:hypothetical protein